MTTHNQSMMEWSSGRLFALLAAAILAACGGSQFDADLASESSDALVAPIDASKARGVLDLAGQKLGRAAAVTATTQYPRSTRADGTWTTIPNTDLRNWTQGFFPGSLWAMYAQTGDSTWRTRADAWTRNLELQKTNTQTHDLGFKLYDSFGPAWQLTGSTYYRDVLLVAAASLATRYRPIAGVISCCDWNPSWKLPLVVDTMMNIELLLWGAQNGGNPEWRTMALNHALKTLSEAVRSDGSTYHVVDFDPVTGAVRFKGTFQGFSNNSTWTRGQAWAIYGFTMVYRYTHDSRMLSAARKTADYYLGRLPADLVPNWDFSAPTQSKDSSAAAAVASALLELSQLETSSTNKTRYFNAAVQMLGSLASPSYLAAAGTMNLLLHGVGNYPAGTGIDVGLIYGDYYFIEALRRFLAIAPPPVNGVVFQDDFNRTGALGSSWTVATGSYTCDGSAARGAASQSFAFWTGLPAANDTVSMRLATPLSATTTGLLLRANPAALTRDHYRVYIGTDHRIHVSRRLNWSFTILADGPTFPSGTHTVRATATGVGPVLISVKLDGAEVLHVTDSATGSIRTAGRAGLFDVNGAGQRIDLFAINRP